MLIKFYITISQFIENESIQGYIKQYEQYYQNRKITETL